MCACDSSKKRESLFSCAQTRDVSCRVSPAAVMIACCLRQLSHSMTQAMQTRQLFASVRHHRRLIGSSSRTAAADAQDEPLQSQQQQAPATEPLILTESCVSRIKTVASDEEFLRIEVSGGGCSGFQYKFSIDSHLDDQEDVVVSRDGARLVVDRTSLELIRGSQIDYREELIRSAFAVVSNPNAEKGCSCGASFALKSPG